MSAKLVQDFDGKLLCFDEKLKFDGFAEVVCYHSTLTEMQHLQLPSFQVNTVLSHRTISLKKNLRGIQR